jgi:hypothetical protein
VHVVREVPGTGQEAAVELEARVAGIIEREPIAFEGFEPSHREAAELCIVEVLRHQLGNVALVAIDPAAIRAALHVPGCAPCGCSGVELRGKAAVEADEHSGLEGLVGHYPQIQPAAHLMARIGKVVVPAFPPQRIVIPRMPEFIVGLEHHPDSPP